MQPPVFSLPIVPKWTLTTADCSPAELILLFGDDRCSLTAGSMLNGVPIVGLWDEAAQKLIFIHQPGDATTSAVYTGYLMVNPNMAPCAIAGWCQTMANATPITGSCSRWEFGWFANPS